jgi:hypothetical protein
VNIPFRKLTRRELPEFLGEHGYQVSLHTLNRLCGPAGNGGPPPAGVWGTRILYDAREALAWAEQRAGIKKSPAPHDIARILQEAGAIQEWPDVIALCERVSTLTASLPPFARQRLCEHVTDLIRESLERP